MLLKTRIVAAAVACVLSAAFARAQETAPGQDPPRVGTRRGAADFASTRLVRPDAASPLSLIASDAVAEELTLTPEQKQKLEELQKATAEKQRALQAELQKRAAEANQEAEAALLKLLDEKQNRRMGELQLQRVGITALTRPEVAAKLGLNDEQREKLTKLAEDYRRVPPFGPGFDRGPGTAPADAPAAAPRGRRGPGVAARVRETREQLAAEMLAILTAEQKTKWEAMRGARFEFPVPTFRGPAGPFDGPSAPLAVRISPFELGQNLRDPAPTRIAQNLGPAGPFRYKVIVDALGLSEEQKERVCTIGAEDVKAVEELRELPELEILARFGAVNQATQEKIDKVLTDEQKAKLKELITPPRSARP
jgi:hypothetical protein